MLQEPSQDPLTYAQHVCVRSWRRVRDLFRETGVVGCWSARNIGAFVCCGIVKRSFWLQPSLNVWLPKINTLVPLHGGRFVTHRHHARQVTTCYGKSSSAATALRVHSHFALSFPTWFAVVILCFLHFPTWRSRFLLLSVSSRSTSFSMLSSWRSGLLVLSASRHSMSFCISPLGGHVLFSCLFQVASFFHTPHARCQQRIEMWGYPALGMLRWVYGFDGSLIRFYMGFRRGMPRAFFVLLLYDVGCERIPKKG